MEAIRKIKVDYSDIKGAISDLDELSSKIEDIKEDSIDLGKETTNSFDEATKGASKLTNSMEALKNSISGAFSSLGKLVARFGTLRNVIVGTVGAALFSAAGTTRESSQGSALNIGWAGARAKETIDDLMGISPDFASARDAVSSYDTKGPLAALGITQTEASELYKKGADASYFEIASRYEKKLRQLIDEAGGDRAMGIQNFGAIYGEGLSQTLGTNVGDFASLTLNGQMDRYKNLYYQRKSEYSGVNTKPLIEGETHLNSFMSKLKVLTLTLSSELLPSINKVMGPVTEFLKNTIQWAKESQGLKAAFNLLTEIAEFFVNLIKSLIEAISESTFGSFMAQNAEGFSKAIQNANKATKEEGFTAGLAAFASTTWSEQQKIGKNLNAKNEGVIKQYEDDKAIRRQIAASKGYISSEYFKSLTKEGVELREYAKTLNINIILKDSNGRNIGEAQIQDIVNKGLNPTVSLTQR